MFAWVWFCLWYFSPRYLESTLGAWGSSLSAATNSSCDRENLGPSLASSLSRSQLLARNLLGRAGWWIRTRTVTPWIIQNWFGMKFLCMFVCPFVCFFVRLYVCLFVCLLQFLEPKHFKKATDRRLLPRNENRYSQFIAMTSMSFRTAIHNARQNVRHFARTNCIQKHILKFLGVFGMRIPLWFESGSKRKSANLRIVSFPSHRPMLHLDL